MFRLVVRTTAVLIISIVFCRYPFLLGIQTRPPNVNPDRSRLLFFVFLPLIVAPSIHAMTVHRFFCEPILARKALWLSALCLIGAFVIAALSWARGAEPHAELAFARSAIGLDGPALFVHLDRYKPKGSGFHARWDVATTLPTMNGLVLHDDSNRWGSHSMGRYGEHLKVPLWMIAWNVGLPSLVHLFSRRPLPGHCRCGYDLTGNISGVCPECGAAIQGRSKPRLKPADRDGWLGGATNQLKLVAKAGRLKPTTERGHRSFNHCVLCGSA